MPNFPYKTKRDMARDKLNVSVFSAVDLDGKPIDTIDPHLNAAWVAQGLAKAGIRGRVVGKSTKPELLDDRLRREPPREAPIRPPL